MTIAEALLAGACLAALLRPPWRFWIVAFAIVVLGAFVGVGG